MRHATRIRILVIFALSVCLMMSGCTKTPRQNNNERKIVFYPNDKEVRVVWRSMVTERDLADYLEYQPLEDGIAGVDANSVYIGGRSGKLFKLNRQDGKLIKKRNIGYEIFSRPVLRGNMLYLGTASGSLLAMSKNDLSDIWQYDAKSEILAPPTIEGDTLYLITQDDILTALDAKSGKFKWEYREEYQSKMIIRRHASPVVVGDVLYQGFTNGAICAFDRQNGKKNWCRNLGRANRFDEVNATPIIKDGRLYTASFDNGVFCLDAKSGLNIWDRPIKSVATPLLIGTTLYITASEDGFYGLDCNSGKTRFHFDMEEIYMEKKEGALSRPLRYMDDMIVFSTSHGGLYFFDYPNRRFIDRFTPGNGISATPTPYGRQIYCLTNGGYIYSIAIGRKSSPFAPHEKPRKAIR